MELPSLNLPHYRILGNLGRGGFGEVYRAMDTRLNRVVALKVLPSEMTSDEDRRKRFVQEAKTASALNHPNIVTIYETGVDESSGRPVHYIAMEYVSGKTLHECIGRKG